MSDNFGERSMEMEAEATLAGEAPADAQVGQAEDQGEAAPAKEAEDPRLAKAQSYVDRYKAVKGREDQEFIIEQEVLADPDMRALYDDNRELMIEHGWGDLLSSKAQ